MSENVQLLRGSRTISQSQDAMRALYDDDPGQQAAQKQRRRERLAAKQDGICPECGLPLPEGLAETEIDHIIPRARGGPNVPWNKRLLHLKCNRSKQARLTPEAVELAARYGVRVHQIQPSWAHATRPLTRAASQREAHWVALFRASSREEVERLIRERLEAL